MIMTDEELAAIRARAEAATPGPWDYWFRGHGEAAVGPEYTPIPLIITHQLEDGRGPHGVDADTAFVAHARADIPALLTEVARLRAGMRGRQAEMRVVQQNFAALQAENANLRAIVRAVVHPPMGCNLTPVYLPDMLYQQARALAMAADDHYGRCAMCGDFITNEAEHGVGICYHPESDRELLSGGPSFADLIRADRDGTAEEAEEWGDDGLAESEGDEGSAEEEP